MKILFLYHPYKHFPLGYTANYAILHQNLYFSAMGKSIILGALALFLFSCSQDKKVEVKNDTLVVFHAEKLPKLLNISQNAMDILKDWPEYNAL